MWSKSLSNFALIRITIALFADLNQLPSSKDGGSGLQVTSTAIGAQIGQLLCPSASVQNLFTSPPWDVPDVYDESMKWDWKTNYYLIAWIIVKTKKYMEVACADS